MFGWITTDGRSGICFAADSIHATKVILHYLNCDVPKYGESDIQLAVCRDPRLEEIGKTVFEAGNGAVLEFRGDEYHRADLLPRIPG